MAARMLPMDAPDVNKLSASQGGMKLFLIIAMKIRAVAPYMY
jgi:hypothetical protein